MRIFLVLFLISISCFAMRANNSYIVSSAAMTANINSAPTLLDQVFTASIQATWTGTPVGIFNIQVSNDKGLDPAGGGTPITNWSDLAASSVAAGGAAGNFAWNLNDIGYRWARLHYEFSSSTGTLSVRQNTKGF